MKTKTRFAWKQFLKNLAIIAIPVALQNMLTTTGSMIDTIMIAPLGETTVGAGPLRTVFLADVCGLLGLFRRRHAVFLAVLGRAG